MTDEMAEAYKRDSDQERAMRELARGIEKVLKDGTQIGPAGRELLEGAVEELRHRADQIVRVWD